MSGLVSIDTNFIVYALDPTAGERHATARALLPVALERGVITQQVLGELLNVARKSNHLDVAAVRRFAADLASGSTILRTTSDLLLDAFDLATRRKLQFWDAVILTVCRANGVAVLLTEDMQDGATLDGVTVLNPFNPANRPRMERLLPA